MLAMRHFRLFLLLAATFLLAAATYNPALFNSMTWRSVGPPRGGRSIDCAGSSSRPLEYYFGATGGGLWKTTDGGLTWRPVTDGQIKSSSIGAVAVSQSNPDIVYIGMGETELRGNIMQGDGVYKSTDAGKTWKHMGLADTQAISRIRVHPTNPDIVYVSALGHPYGANAERGVFRSKDGGQTWKKVLYKDDHAGAVDLCLDPHNPNVLFAAIWDVYRTPWRLFERRSAQRPLQIDRRRRSLDRNHAQSRDCPQALIGKIGVVGFGRRFGNRVYAMVENENGGVYRFRRCRRHLEACERGSQAAPARLLLLAHLCRPESQRHCVRAERGLLEIDGWRQDLPLDTPAARRQSRSVDRSHQPAAHDQKQRWRRHRLGQWRRNLDQRGVSHGAALPCGDDQGHSVSRLRRAAGQLDHLRFERRRRRSWRRGRRRPRRSAPYSVGGGESGYIAPDPKNANIFYAGSQGALLTRFDRRTNYAKDVQVYPLFFSGENAGSLPERWQWTYPIVFSPVDPEIIYTSSQHLWKTNDEGHTWKRISPDLTRHDPKTLGDSGGPITHDQNGPEIYATIFAIAPSHKDVNTIWTGSDDGLV